MKAPTRYPLAWPRHRPRTKDRRKGSSSMTVDGKSQPVSLATAVDRLERQVELLGGAYMLLSTNIEPRLDGRPRVDRAPPADPGVCVYFQISGRPYAMACDTFTETAQNIAALANHIDATRRIAAYGVATAAEVLEAFAALPPPERQTVASRRWWRVLGFSSAEDLVGFPRAVRLAMVKAAYDEAAKLAHPDRGGSNAAMAELNAARDEAMDDLRDGDS